MSLERFAYANVFLVPIVAGGTYLFQESIPVVAVPFIAGYLTFAILISFGWGMSVLSQRLRSS